MGAEQLETSALAPTREYFLNEAVSAQYRARDSTLDVGAFERVTVGVGYGPYGAGDAGIGVGPPRVFGTGCGCHASGAALGLLTLLTLVAQRARRRCAPPL